MENNQQAANHILTLKRTLKYDEKKMLEEGNVEPVISSVRKRTTRFYRFMISVVLVVFTLGIARVIFGDVSFLDVFFPFSVAGFIAVFGHKNFKDIDKILNESESML
jgi:uncharacterized membrane protein YcjF (UPF0283 family)